MLFSSFLSVNRRKFLRWLTEELKYYKNLLWHSSPIPHGFPTPFRNLLINFNKRKKKEKTKLKTIKYINLDLIHFEQEHTRT